MTPAETPITVERVLALAAKPVPSWLPQDDADLRRILRAYAAARRYLDELDANGVDDAFGIRHELQSILNGSATT